MTQTRRAWLRSAGALAVLPLLMGAGQAPPPRRIEFTAQQAADLDRISAYLNGLKTLEASFVQFSTTGGEAQGQFYLARPGRLRFEYRPPSPTLIVATDGRIYVKNSRLNTVDRYDVSDTPLGLLLNPAIDLKRNPAVLGVDREADTLVLHARTSTNRTRSNVTIIFGADPMQLRQWVVKDAQGGVTDVALTEAHSGVALDEALFAVPAKTPRPPGAP